MLLAKMLGKDYLPINAYSLSNSRKWLHVINYVTCM